jgi:hypothetical protein
MKEWEKRSSQGRLASLGVWLSAPQRGGQERGVSLAESYPPVQEHGGKDEREERASSSWSGERERERHSKPARGSTRHNAMLSLIIIHRRLFLEGYHHDLREVRQVGNLQLGCTSYIDNMTHLIRTGRVNEQRRPSGMYITPESST